MSAAAAHRAAIDAPSPRDTMDRLHNSGWGRPPEMYRTPMLGQLVLLDLPRLLGAWAEVPHRERPALQDAIRAARSPRRRRPLPVALVAQLAARARWSLDQRHATPLQAAGVAVSPTAHLPVRPDALVELARLRDRVNALDWTAGIVLTHAPDAPGDDASPINWSHPTNGDEVALALVTASLLHGTMVLWGAEPSLEPLRDARRPALRWLRPAQAHAAARAQWAMLVGARP